MRSTASILAAVLALTVEASVRFTEPAWRPDLGIAVPALANAQEEPLEPRRARRPVDRAQPLRMRGKCAEQLCAVRLGETRRREEEAEEIAGKRGREAAPDFRRKFRRVQLRVHMRGHVEDVAHAPWRERLRRGPGPRPAGP